MAHKCKCGNCGNDCKAANIWKGLPEGPAGFIDTKDPRDLQAELDKIDQAVQELSEKLDIKFDDIPLVKKVRAIGQEYLRELKEINDVFVEVGMMYGEGTYSGTSIAEKIRYQAVKSDMQIQNLQDEVNQLQAKVNNLKQAKKDGEARSEAYRGLILDLVGK